MPESDLWLLVLAVLIQAPFAFRLGAVVRDGREHVAGGMFLALGAALAAIAVFLTGSLLLAVCAALAPVLLLAHARFLAAHRAPAAAGNPEAGGEAMVAAAPAPEPPPPDALHAGMAFIGDMLETADRLGELRHQRRLRRLARQKAERALAAPPAAPARVPELQFRARPRRGPVRLPPPE